MHPLRLQAEVGTDRDTQTCQGFDQLTLIRAALQLDHIGTGFFHKSPGILYRLFSGGVGQERHIQDQQRALQATRHGFA